MANKKKIYFIIYLFIPACDDETVIVRQNVWFVGDKSVTVVGFLQCLHFPDTRKSIYKGNHISQSVCLSVRHVLSVVKYTKIGMPE